MLKCKLCNNYKKLNQPQLSLELIRFNSTEKVISYNKVPSANSFKTLMDTYKHYPIIITDKVKLNEFHMRHLLIGQERLMLKTMLNNAEIKNINFLICPVNWCSGLYNFNTSDLCFKNILTLIYYLQPTIIIIYDNDKNLLKRKMNKFLNTNEFNFKFMIPLKNIITHGATWHPWYLQQVQTLKKLYKEKIFLT